MCLIAGVSIGMSVSVSMRDCEIASVCDCVSMVRVCECESMRVCTIVHEFWDCVRFGECEWKKDGCG